MEENLLNRIGLRKEEKSFETRVALIPNQVKFLTDKYDIEFVVEPSSQRAFEEKEFEEVGATTMQLKGSSVPVVLGIKEMPIDFFEKDIAYIFFSHTIKGQKYNMPMLQHIMNTGSTLIDYERVVDDNGRRLIYFGNWAGMAGISDTFRILGERFDAEGTKPNPFAGMRTTLELKGLDAVKEEFKLLAERIQTQGLPEELTPFVVGFAGYGNVSRGAQMLFDLLPHKEVSPENLQNLKSESNLLYKCVFKEEDMVTPTDTSRQFELQDYYKSGKEGYTGVFHNYVQYLTVIMNCIYWTKKYPRLITKDFIRKHWNEESRKLRAIGDISCDVGGAIEFTLDCTTPAEPAFVYLPDDDKIRLGVHGDGPVVIAVDNLPCELPRESSTSFGETLLEFIPALAKADFKAPFEDLDLPREIKDAIIVYRGELTKNFEYLNQYLN
jgi:alpha-aminoadipic semialdehyde synthase